MEHFFPRNQVETCAQMHTKVKLLEGMQMNTILKLLGGIPSNYWRDLSSPGFGTTANDIKLDNPKLRECAHFILCLVTLGCRPHFSAFLCHWRLVRSLKKVG